MRRQLSRFTAACPLVQPSGGVGRWRRYDVPTISPYINSRQQTNPVRNVIYIFRVTVIKMITAPSCFGNEISWSLLINLGPILVIIFVWI